jgi:hypothetical protein
MHVPRRNDSDSDRGEISHESNDLLGGRGRVIKALPFLFCGKWRRRMFGEAWGKVAEHTFKSSF